MTFGDDVLLYFFIMDQFVFGDALTDQLGSRVAEEKLADRAGYCHIGDMVADPPEVVAAKAGLSPAQLAKLVRYLDQYGITLGSDTSGWRAYRQRMPDRGRLPWSFAMSDAETLAQLYFRLSRACRESGCPAPALPSGQV